MVRAFERKRKALVKWAAQNIQDGNAKTALLLRLFCAKNGIPATDEQLQDVINDAIKYRVVQRYKALDERVTTLEDQIRALNQKVNNLHP